jgi:YHS domain-containing protein
MARDPVCGMEVHEPHATASLEYKGRKFYFCAVSCYEAFKKIRTNISPAKRWGGGTGC